MTLHQFRNEIRLKHRPIAFFLTYSGVRHASLFGQELPSFSMVGFQQADIPERWRED